MITSGVPSATSDTSWPPGAVSAAAALGVGFGSSHRKYAKELPPVQGDSAQAQIIRRQLEAEAKFSSDQRSLSQQAEALRKSDRLSLFSDVGFMAQSLAQNETEKTFEPTTSLKNSSLAAYRAARDLVDEEQTEKIQLFDKTESLYSHPVIDLLA